MARTSRTSTVRALAVVPDRRPHRPALAELALDRLAPHPRNVRRDPGDITELAASIAARGVLEPLLVVPVAGDVAAAGVPRGVTHVVVAGHRRLAAARLAGLAGAPCIVRHDLDGDVDVLLAMLAENLQRCDLSPIEEATAYDQLELYGLDTAAIAARTGRSRATVEARLVLLDLPEPTRERVHARQVTLEQASELAAAAQDPNPAIFAQLDAAAGTHDWPVALGRVRARQESDGRAAARRAALAEAGVRVVERADLPGDSRWTHHLGWLLTGSYQPPADDVVDAHRDCPGHACLAPTGDEPADPAAGFWLCLRPELHAPGPDVGPDVDRHEHDAAEAARLEAEREAVRRLAEDCAAAATARRAWLSRYCSARRSMPARHGRAIARHLARLAVVTWPEPDPGQWLSTLLGVDVQEEDLSAVQAQLGDLAAVRDPYRVLLAMIAAEAEREASYHSSWSGGRVATGLLGWLDLLADLGWTPSTWEQERITAARALATPTATPEA